MNSIILIGPVRSGKSTIGKLLAERLGSHSVSMDDHYFEYKEEIEEGMKDVDKDQLSDWFKNRQLEKAIWAQQIAYANVLERFLFDYPGSVIDLGAGHSVYEGAAFERVSKILEPYHNIFLLMPTPDIDESIAILHERLTYEEHIVVNPLFVRHPSNIKLAKHVVYTKGKTPKDTCQEIATLINDLID